MWHGTNRAAPIDTVSVCSATGLVQADPDLIAVSARAHSARPDGGRDDGAVPGSDWCTLILDDKAGAAAVEPQHGAEGDKLTLHALAAVY